MGGGEGAAALLAISVPDLLCGPFRAPERISSLASARYADPYTGLEPSGGRFLVVYARPRGSVFQERLPNGAYTAPRVLHRSLRVLSMQWVSTTVTRLAIFSSPSTHRLYTPVLQTARPSSWGRVRATPFRASGADPQGTISPPVGASLADPVVFRWGAEIRVYVIERWTSGRSAVAYVASPDHGRTWSDPVGVPIAAPGRAAPAHLTGLTVCKSRDGTIPVLLLGAFDPARRAWALMAVPEMA